MIASVESVRSLIRDCEPASANVDLLDADVPLKKQGIDSLELMTILMKLEDAFHVKVRDEDVGKLESIASIVEYLKDNQGT